MAHLLHKYHSSALFLGIGMLMLFSFCAPAFASDAPATPTFRSTSPFGINQTIKEPATVNINGIHQGTIYKPFSSDHPYADLNPGSGSGGSSDPNDDVGIPGWADTPSEPLPIGDGMGILLLMATMMVGAIFLKQRKQLSESISKSTTSTTNINNLRGNQLPTALKKENNTTQHMTTRKQTYQSFFQKLFLLLVFVCMAGQVSAKVVYFRPSTILVGDVAWAKSSSDCWFPMLRVSNYNNSSRKMHMNHYQDTYISNAIYDGTQSRFLGYTVSSESDGFAFYRVDEGGAHEVTTSYWSIPTDKTVGSCVYDCVPYNKWWTNNQTYYSHMFTLSNIGSEHNLVCMQEGTWGSTDQGYYFAFYVVNDVHLYFANENNWTTPMFARGKDVYSYKETTTKIDGTNLYYTYLKAYNDIAYRKYAYIDDKTGSWEEIENLWKKYEKTSTTQANINANKLDTRLGGFTKRSKAIDDHRLDDTSKGTTHLFIPSSTSNNPALTKSAHTSYTALNYTLTVKTYSAVKHKANTSPTYNDDNNNTNGGTIEYSAYKLSGQGTSDLTEGSSSTASTDITAAYTGTIVLTAVPKTGYKFVGWYSSTGDLLSTDLKWTTEKTKGNTTIHARFMSYNKQIRMQTYGYDQKSQTYKWLEVADGGKKITIAYNDGTGNKTEEKTTAAPLNIYPQEGTTVQLNAVAQDNYTFVGWWNNYDQRYDNNPWSFLPEETNQSITARFAPSRQQTINVHTYDNEQDTYVLSGNGGYVNIAYTQLTTTVNDGYITTNTDVTTQNTYTALYNTSVTLTATPNTNYAFLGWYEGENKVGSNTTYTYPATTERNITARFHKPFTQAFDVQTEIGGQYQNSTTGGTATITYNNTTTNLTDQVLSISNMEQGTMVILNATPKSGYRFVGWYNGSGELDSSEPEYTYRAEGTRTVHARFARSDVQLVVAVMNYNTDYAEFVEYPHDNNTVTIAYGGNNTTVTSSTSAVVNYGSQVTLTATPDDHKTEGYHFIGWYQNNQRISTNPTYTFTITDHSAISAHFAPKQCHKVILYHTFGGQYQVKYARPELFDSENGYYVANSLYNKDTTIFVPYEAKLTIIASTAKPTIGYEYTGYRVWPADGGKQNDGTYIINPGMTNGVKNIPQVFVGFVRTEEQVVYLDLSSSELRDGWADKQKYFVCARNLATSPTIVDTIQLQQVKDKLYTTTLTGDKYSDVTFYYEGKDSEGKFKRISTTPSAIPATRFNCMKLNGAWNSVANGYVDVWTTLDTENGDYRLIYREQTVVDKNTIRVDYEFNEGDRIKKRTTEGTDIVSLHIYNKVSGNVNGVNNPEVILQQWSDNEDAWVDVERYMVFGPLRSNDASVIKMPNRKNTANEVVRVDLGINNIMTDKTDNGCGVWNFVIEQDGTTARLLVDQTHRYEGDYFIRTSNADGQWYNYTIPASKMTYSEYAKKNSDFSHYFCRYIDLDETGTAPQGAGSHKNVKFTVANRYAAFLCSELLINNTRFTDDEYEDDIFVNQEWNGKTYEPSLPVDATVRFGWDIVTNRLTRAYIADTEFKNNEYLIVEGDKIGDVSGEKAYFDEIGDHFYQIDLSAQVPSDIKVKAKMNGNYQYFMGSENATGQLIGGKADGSYPVRLLYDFKNDRFITICELTGTINGNINLETSVMIVREHNDAPKQLTFANNDASITATPNVPNTGQDQYTKPAYAVMTFLEDKLLDNNVSKYEKMFYWISFPFDVKISDVFGLGEYGKYWIMEEYDGKQRSENGLAQTNWKYITKKSHVLKQNVGYVLCLNYNQILQDQLFTSHGAGEFRHSKLSLYFPSNSVISQAMLKGGQSVPITLEKMESNATAWNHHNWHLIGVPSFADPDFTDIQQDAPFVYEYWHPGDAYAAVSINDVEFQAMHAYMVQYYGDIIWTSVVNTGGSVSKLAAKTDEQADKNIMLRLELQQAGSTLDKTYVQLRNDKGTKGFDMSLDLTKIINAGANIYSIVDNHEMAGNAIPKDETVLPLGVVITAAGEYTFAMPNGTEGMIVELIDYEQGTSTNLLMSDYTITLNKGTFNQRFALRLKPDKVATSVDNIGNDADGDKVRKLLIDGVLYLQQGTNTYDAQGKHVQ